MRPVTPAEAQAELAQALEQSDAGVITRAGALVERLEPAARRQSLAGAALWYAARGVPVFPCWPGTKRPASMHGLDDGTTDLERVRGWWSLRPQSNIGLVTGVRFDAVDIDGPEGQASRARLWCSVAECAEADCAHEPGTFARIERDQLGKVLTPRPGGMHVYVPVTGSGNRAHIFPGVDYRGVGGYVVAPPSVITPGGKDHPGRYEYLGTPRLEGDA